MNSRKYPRTHHFPFSPGATSDDRIAKSFDRLLNEPIVVTEKLDGENTCLNQYGVFARSHAAPTQNPWASYLWDTWNLIGPQLGELELFGESLYAIHSIEYSRLTSYFYLFGIREGERWLSWADVEFYSGVLGLPTVPVLFTGTIDSFAEGGNLAPAEKLKRYIGEEVLQPSSLSNQATAASPREGVVVRVAASFTTEEFPECVCKWVRPNHVRTREHWTRNWRKAALYFGED